MKLSKFLERLTKLAESRPELLDTEVIYAVDDEGNEFNKVSFGPTVGRFEDGKFCDEDCEDLEEDADINAVCIN